MAVDIETFKFLATKNSGVVNIVPHIDFRSVGDL